LRAIDARIIPVSDLGLATPAGFRLAFTRRSRRTRAVGVYTVPSKQLYEIPPSREYLDDMIPAGPGARASCFLDNANGENYAQCVMPANVILQRTRVLEKRERKGCRDKLPHRPAQSAERLTPALGPATATR
jgi:hypothetical protein